jgi:hypothetical protein
VDQPLSRKRLGAKAASNTGAIMQQASSPVLQQLRSLHPGALQTLHQSPDGTLYPHSQVLPELQNLHTSDVYQQQYALSGPPHPQPPSHAHALPVHFEQHALPPSGPYPPFQPAGYQHGTSPRFMNAPAPPLQDHAQQYHAPPQTIQRPIQQLPLPPATQPIAAAPQPLQRHVEQAPLPHKQESQDGYVSIERRPGDRPTNILAVMILHRPTTASSKAYGLYRTHQSWKNGERGCFT